MDVQQSLQNQHGNTFMNEKLDLAFIYFFQQFKKSYMSESNGRDVSVVWHCVQNFGTHLFCIVVFIKDLFKTLQSVWYQ